MFVFPLFLLFGFLGAWVFFPLFAFAFYICVNAKRVSMGGYLGSAILVPVFTCAGRSYTKAEHTEF